MIRIDDERNLLLMFHDIEGKNSTSINEKIDCGINEYPLISGYVCPKCNEVLRAYYIGIPSHLTDKNSHSTNPYLTEKTKSNSYSSYAGPSLNCKEGICKGGSYFYLRNHENFCELRVFEYRGILYALTQLYASVKSKDTEPLTKHQLNLLAERILNNEVPGLIAIRDVCNVDEPLLAINGKEMGSHASSAFLLDRLVEYMIKYADTELPPKGISIDIKTAETAISTE